MATLVLDIETVGVDWETLHEDVRAYLLRAADREPTDEQRAARAARIRDETSLFPLTGRIVAIAAVDVDSGRGHVWYDSPGAAVFTEDGATFVGGSEVESLRGLWAEMAGCRRAVTFNGRTFDVPYLLLRSAVHGLRPSRSLRPPAHVDLLDELSFHGDTRRYTLDFYCRAFGIASPKSGGVQGSDVPALHRAGRLLDIARYCLRDTRATAELYRRWRETLCLDDQTGEDAS